MRFGLTDTDTQNLISDLLIKWEESFEQGNEISAEELCADQSELLSELQQKIRALKKMAWMSHDTDEDSSEEFVGRVLNQRYEIKNLIGFGGYGNVFKAFDKELERFVAVKIPHAHRVSISDEAKVAAKFQTDGIVSVHDVGSDNGTDYIVSEMIEGLNLRDYANKNNLTWKQSVKLISKVATNLQKAHDADLIHRDIKPENILVDFDGNPHIADFGITSAGSESANFQKGTLAYMSPEQIAGESQLVDQRCDSYSLGVVLFELLTGSLLHSSQDSGKLREQILLAEPDFNSIQPEHVKVVCKKALAKHPDARYQTAAEFATALNECLSNRQPVNPVWKRRVFLSAAISGLIALSFLSGLFWQSTDWTSLKGGEVFDGTKRIVTDVDSFFPCTIEAWVAPSTEKQQWIVGSDVPSQFGIGIGIKNGGHLMVETIKGGMHDPDSKIALDSWSHLAAVFGEDETRMYLNGKLVGTCLLTEAPKVPSKFVIGNLGEKHQTQYFNGRIKSVRISKGEVYDGAFTPKQVLDQDDSTVHLFDKE
jgi:serine/threonine protein kinase